MALGFHDGFDPALRVQLAEQDVEPLDVADLRPLLAAERRAVLDASIYERLTDERRLVRFMASHVFAVWDFQSLLISLQRHVGCVDVPWLPPADPEAVRLVNEIVLDEQSDRGPNGGHASHFELYLRAMDDAGADSTAVRTLLLNLRDGQRPSFALSTCGAPAEAAAFTRSTLAVARDGAAHEVAAAFAYGREEVIPEMFRRVVARLSEAGPTRWGAFRHYLELHIETDEDRHGPGARRLVASLCGDDPVKSAEALKAARSALEARAALWHALAARLDDERAAV